MGQRWKELSKVEKAAYKQGLTLLPSKTVGRGGARFWAPRPPSAAAPASSASEPNEALGAVMNLGPGRFDARRKREVCPWQLNKGH